MENRIRMEVWGFEPQTFSMPLRRAPNCATPPHNTHTLYRTSPSLRKEVSAIVKSIQVEPPNTNYLTGNAHLNWRERVGIEPTGDGCNPPPTRF